MQSENEWETQHMADSSAVKAGNGAAKTGNGGSLSAPTARTQLATIETGARGLVLKDLDSMWRFATAVVKGGMAPKSMTKPEQVLIALQMGAELGLTPMMSLKTIAVVNGTPSVWGAGVPALCMNHPLFESLKEEWSGQGETRKCTVTMRRKNNPEPTIRTFGYTDAKRAGLLSRDTYKNYPDRMYQCRARAWAANDCFPDAMMGLSVAEEVQDLAFSQTAGTSIESGDDAPLSSLDAAADLLEKDGAIDAEFTDSGDDVDDEWPENATTPTREELADQAKGLF
jgi:hypothetical protein